jgi:hypothetical protein
MILPGSGPLWHYREINKPVLPSVVVGEPGTPEEMQPQIQIQPEQMAGVWANFAQVSHSPYEFTLDFIRLDYSQQPPRGIVVSRVALSPLMVSQLIDALQQNWTIYAQRALPQEVYGSHDEPGTDDSDAQPS